MLPPRLIFDTMPAGGTAIPTASVAPVTQRTNWFQHMQRGGWNPWGTTGMPVPVATECPMNNMQRF